MTACRTDDISKSYKHAKRSIRSFITLAAASLCIVGAITGCTTSGAVLADVPTSASASAPASASASASAGEACVSSLNPDTSAEVTASSGSESAAAYPTLRCSYYNEKDFMASVEAVSLENGNGTKKDADKSGIRMETDGSPVSPDNKTGAGNAGQNTGGDSSGKAGIVGGITPHHLLAAKMIAGFFRQLSEDPPKTIIIVGPNHKRIGFNGLHTSASDWGTPFGRLEADRGVVSTLSEKLGAVVDDELMQNEHSISSLVPYIRYYLPDARIVPILLHGNYPAEDSVKLGKLLGIAAAANPGDIAIVASVDFSHYLDAATAYRMDAITLKAIQKQDIPAISKMTNDNMDSPPSIITLLTAMDLIGAAGPDMAGHSNSSDIACGGYDNTTSYFTLFYRNIDK